ncbi:MAG: hypothetical protein IJY39_09540 [Clostridia bacterium]|nr:hypothetical protein [Clostridia bacterium]
MIESIMTYIADAIFLIVSLILYVFVTACLLPKILLVPTCNASSVKDRGIKKYIFEQGRAIVYQPAVAERRYVSQYILSDNAGERFLKCKLDQRIRSLKYRVLTFDANDKPLDILDVEEPVTSPGYAKAVPLPLNTAYVSVSVKEVNGTRVAYHKSVSYSLIKLAIYFAVTVILTVIEALLLNRVIVFLANLIFGLLRIPLPPDLNLSFIEIIAPNNSYAVFTALLLGSAYAALVLLTHYSKDIKIVK